MKKFISCVYFIISIVSFSQGTVEILDAQNKQAVISAKVVFYPINSQNDSIVLRSNLDGVVDIPISCDTIFIKIESIGFENYVGFINGRINNTIELREKNYNLGTVVVTGQYSPNFKSNSIYNIEVVDDKEIEEKGSTNMQEVLNNQLAFKTNNGHTNETSLNINGLSGSHVKFMIDGVPVEGRVNGNVDLSQLNSQDIERVEIIEGPISVVYGTNALGGIVNIITKKTSQKKVASSFNSYYETVGKYNLSAGVSFKKDDAIIKFSGGRHFFAGYSENDTSRSMLWKPREQYFGKVLFGYRFKKFNLSIIANGFQETMISKGELRAPYFTTAFDTYNQTRRFSNSYLFNGAFNKKSYLNLTLAYSFYERQRNIFFKDLTTLNSYLSDGSNDQDRTRYNNFIFRGFYSYKVKEDKFSFLIGTEVKQDFIQAKRVENYNQNMGNYAIYASLNYRPFKNIILQPAIRYDYNTRYRAPIVPSFIIQANIKSFKIKGFYARGFRTPSLKELFLEFHYNETINLWGNKDLSAENSNHFMFSCAFEKKNSKIEAKLFHNRIKGLIDLVKISEIDWEYDNIGFFITKGANLSYAFDYKGLNLSLAYSYIGTYDGQFSSNTFENTFNYSSNFLTGIRYAIKKWKTGVTASFKYIGQTNSFYLDNDGVVKNSSIDDYSIIDLSFYKRLFNEKITIVAGAKNLLNTTEVGLTGNVFGFSTSKNANSMAVLWGRTGFVSISLKL